MTTHSFNYPIIVSGLPRSGTSMMMSMLSAAGYSLLTDKLREPDKNNPKGYFEYEPVKKLMYENEWLYNTKGQVVKIVSPLLTYLPLEQHYKIVFMQRDLYEIIASQYKMMQRSNSFDTNIDSNLAKEFEAHLRHIYNWLNQKSNIEVIYINYNKLMCDPKTYLLELIQFLQLTINIDPMLNIIDGRLYREKR